MSFIDLTGKRFGKIQVISLAKKKNKRTAWNCVCDCGKEKIILRQTIQDNIQSCGCIRLEKSIKHGQSHTKAYAVWANMIKRCYNKKDKAYARYGGKGIDVCERWMTLENFIEDMGQPPEGLSIERLEGKKGYNKENCIWGTKLEQSLNRQRKNKSGLRGVSKCGNKWRAIISSKNEIVHLGLFKDKLDAAKAFLKAYFDKYKKWPPEYKETPLCFITPLHRSSL